MDNTERQARHKTKTNKTKTQHRNYSDQQYGHHKKWG